MATIDKLDIGIYIQYARRAEYIEGVKGQLHLDQAESVVAGAQMTDVSPKLTELEMLLGVSRAYAAWALFYPPKAFNLRRKSPFSFSKVLPSFSSEDEEEDLELLDKIETKTPEEEKEKKVLHKFMKQLHTINEWLGHIIGRRGQLLQG